MRVWPARIDYVMSSEVLATSEGEMNDMILTKAVRKITGGKSLTPLEFARRANSWLPDRHNYSLTERLSPDIHDRDPVIRWLGTRSPGHCEFSPRALFY